MKKNMKIAIALLGVTEVEFQAALAIFAECCGAISDHSNADVLLVAEEIAPQQQAPQDPTAN